MWFNAITVLVIRLKMAGKQHKHFDLMNSPKTYFCWLNQCDLLQTNLKTYRLYNNSSITITQVTDPYTFYRSVYFMKMELEMSMDLSNTK